MIQSVCILGRQPVLGLAELESLYGPLVQATAHGVAGIGLPADAIDFARLGGSTKLATILATVTSSNQKQIEKALLGIVRSPAFLLPKSGKFHLGLSSIGVDMSPAKLNALGLTLKKVIRTRHDGSVRTVPNTTPELSTAQVFHSHLANENGAELLLINTGQQTIVARTVAVQDIDSYTLRDRARPKRDARVGMLPPKLAQTIINLAVGSNPGQTPLTIIDPFCGTGVVLQEALLMGYNVYGTDLEPRMIAYSQANLEWLSAQNLKLEHETWKIEVGDATTHRWEPRPTFIAGETYLGRPFTEVPDRATLEQTVSDVNAILTKFLRNIRPQLTPGTRLCLAMPAWQTRPNTFRRLPLLDSLEKIGYNRVEFERVSSDRLLYYREDQIVARELLVLTVK